MVEKENGTQVKQLNKDLGHINTLIERKNIKKKHKDGPERRYKLNEGGYQWQDRKLRKELRQRKTKLRDTKVESTSINKTTPSRTTEESFIGS